MDHDRVIGALQARCLCQRRSMTSRLRRPMPADNSPAMQDALSRQRLWLIGAVVAIVVLGSLWILRAFLSASLWASILCFSTWPAFLRLIELLRGRRGLAALLVTLALGAVIAVPFVILGSALANNISDLGAAFEKVYQSGPPPLPHWATQIPLLGPHLAARWVALTESSASRLEQLAKLLPSLRSIAVACASLIGTGIVQILLSLFIAFFLFRDGHIVAAVLVAGVERVAGTRGIELLDIAGRTVRAVVYGIIGTALVQGVIAAAGFLIAGIPGAIFLGFVTFLVSIIPGGPLLVAAPAAYWVYRQGSSGWASFVLVLGLVDSTLDNFIRPLLISRGVATPMILVVMGVIGGALSFGLIGLFIGPTLLALAYTLLQEWAASSSNLAIASADPDARNDAAKDADKPPWPK